MFPGTGCLHRTLRAIVIPSILSLTLLGAAAAARDTETARRDMLEGIRTEWTAQEVAAERRQCALGQEPDWIASERARGASYTPDASDSCVAVLERSGRDQVLTAFYGTLAIEMGGNGAASSTLPATIGAAVLNGSGNAVIGNNKSAVVTPALAFDAGFTVAYQEGTAAKQAEADDAKLKDIAQRCLKQTSETGLCFSVGYMYGVQAFRAVGTTFVKR